MDDGMYTIPAAFPFDDPLDSRFGIGYDYSHPRAGCRTRHVANPAALRVRAASNIWFRREKEKEERVRAKEIEIEPSRFSPSLPNSRSQAVAGSRKASGDEPAWAGVLVRPEAMGSGRERVTSVAFDVFAKGGFGVGGRGGKESALRWGWRVVWKEEDDY